MLDALEQLCAALFVVCDCVDCFAGGSLFNAFHIGVLSLELASPLITAVYGRLSSAQIQVFTVFSQMYSGTVVLT